MRWSEHQYTLTKSKESLSSPSSHPMDSIVAVWAWHHRHLPRMHCPGYLLSITLDLIFIEDSGFLFMDGWPIFWSKLLKKLSWKIEKSSHLASINFFLFNIKKCGVLCSPSIPELSLLFMDTINHTRTLTYTGKTSAAKSSRKSGLEVPTLVHEKSERKHSTLLTHKLTEFLIHGPPTAGELLCLQKCVTI